MATGTLEECKRADAILMVQWECPIPPIQMGRWVARSCLGFGWILIYALTLGLWECANIRPLGVLDGVYPQLRSKTLKGINFEVGGEY